jgi:methylmalonyl-CoA epimerase
MSWLPPGPIDHVGIAVHELDTASATYVDLLGAVRGHREVVEGQGVEVLFLELPGTTRLELIAPLDDRSPVARFLAKRGEGLHHICVLVDDIAAALAALQEHEVPLVDATARPGAGGTRIAFLHPQALGGVLLELKERPR